MDFRILLSDFEIFRSSKFFHSVFKYNQKVARSKTKLKKAVDKSSNQTFVSFELDVFGVDSNTLRDDTLEFVTLISQPKRVSRPKITISSNTSQVVRITLPPKTSLNRAVGKCYFCKMDMSTQNLYPSQNYVCPNCSEINLYSGGTDFVKPADSGKKSKPCVKCTKLVSIVGLTYNQIYLCPHCDEEMMLNASLVFYKIKKIAISCCFCRKEMIISNPTNLQHYDCPQCNSLVQFLDPYSLKKVKDRRPFLKRFL